jgi:hypothetical protein
VLVFHKNGVRNSTWEGFSTKFDKIFMLAAIANQVKSIRHQSSFCSQNITGQVLRIIPLLIFALILIA